MPAAHAQWAVIDVGAIAQLVQEVQTLQQALTTAQSELQQAQQAYRSISGARGMDQLLTGEPRNYLPTNWAELQGLLDQNGGGYGTTTAAMQAALTANAVLTATELSALPVQQSQQVQAVRRTTALLQGVTSTALATTSNRFSSLQQLIDAIGQASDQKSILELQARIGAEQDMLANEHSKLEILYRAAQAQSWANQQRAREQVIAGHGAFTERFAPTP
jgi:type IV secretion system protein VirB5